LDINPDLKLQVVNDFIKDEKTEELLKSQSFDYVVDAIDTLGPKVHLIYTALQMGLKVISSLGAGGKSDPSKVQVSDISKSYNCKLGRVLRKYLSRLGIKKGFQVVFSPELIAEDVVRAEAGDNKKSTVGTISYMPPVFSYVFARGYEGKGIMEGLRYGIIFGVGYHFVHLFSQYFVYPIPDALLLKWMAFGFVEFVIAGIVVSLVYKSK